MMWSCCNTLTNHFASRTKEKNNDLNKTETWKVHNSSSTVFLFQLFIFFQLINICFTVVCHPFFDPFNVMVSPWRLRGSWGRLWPRSSAAGSVASQPPRRPTGHPPRDGGASASASSGPAAFSRVGEVGAVGKTKLFLEHFEKHNCFLGHVWYSIVLFGIWWFFVGSSKRIWVLRNKWCSKSDVFQRQLKTWSKIQLQNTWSLAFSIRTWKQHPTAIRQPPVHATVAGGWGRYHHLPRGFPSSRPAAPVQTSPRRPQREKRCCPHPQKAMQHSNFRCCTLRGIKLWNHPLTDNKYCLGQGSSPLRVWQR